MNRRVYFLAAGLVLVAAGVSSFKYVRGGMKISPEASRNLWRVNVSMEIAGKGERAKVRLTLPRDTERQTVYNEHFENAGLTFYVRERPLTGNRIGFWRSELLEGSRTLQYACSVQLKGLAFAFPGDALRPVNALEAYPPEFHTWLNPSDFIQSESAPIQRSLKKVVGRERRIGPAVRKIFDFVRGDVKYRSERGSKDALATLARLEADCGGKARLFAALSRAAGIPSRLVGGIILKDGVKSVTHVWAENYIAGRWIPFDVVNDHYAAIPHDYLELYRGDYALIKHTGLKKFGYFFVIGRERMPPVDYPWSLYGLPIHFQSTIKVLLLIPVGALVVALFRSVVGVPTFGTFAPILLALAFREISLGVGLLCLGIILFCGWLLRALLDRLKILVIPRLSIIVTTVVILVLVMMVVGFRLGEEKMLFISLFPFIILTWTIERFSVLEIEDGLQAALRALGGTTVVAVAAFYLMAWNALRVALFTSPELLLVVMAALLLLGRYTGIRVTELVRFREFVRLGKGGPG